MNTKTSAANAGEVKKMPAKTFEVGDIVRLTKTVRLGNSETKILKGHEGMISHATEDPPDASTYYTATFEAINNWVTAKADHFELVKPLVHQERIESRFIAPKMPTDAEAAKPPSPSALSAPKR